MGFYPPADKTMEANVQMALKVGSTGKVHYFKAPLPLEARMLNTRGFRKQ